VYLESTQKKLAAVSQSRRGSSVSSNKSVKFDDRRDGRNSRRYDNRRDDRRKSRDNNDRSQYKSSDRSSVTQTSTNLVQVSSILKKRKNDEASSESDNQESRAINRTEIETCNENQVSECIRGEVTLVEEMEVVESFEILDECYEVSSTAYQADVNSVVVNENKPNAIQQMILDEYHDLIGDVRNASHRFKI
jgi:hypothetical protein